MEIFRNNLVRIDYHPETNVATTVYDSSQQKMLYVEAISSSLDELNHRDISKWMDLFENGTEYYPGLSVQAELIWTKKKSGKQAPALGDNSAIIDQLDGDNHKDKRAKQMTGVFEGIDNITNWIKSRD